jgi:hypothetical protein
MVLLLYRARLEESRLSEYSMEYREYRKRTGFIFPRFRRPGAQLDGNGARRWRKTGGFSPVSIYDWILQLGANPWWFLRQSRVDMLKKKEAGSLRPPNEN